MHAVTVLATVRVRSLIAVKEPGAKLACTGFPTAGIRADWAPAGLVVSNARPANAASDKAKLPGT